MIRRRDFVTLLGGAAAWPIAARGQQRLTPVIGILGSGTAEASSSRLAWFMQGLKETGFADRQNVAIEYHWADDHYDHLPEMAADLVRRRVSLIATFGNSLAGLAAKSATTTIPVVFFMGADPVQLGVVASLNRPGGNITGVSALATDLVQKRFQLLHDAVPGVRVFGLIVNPANLRVNSVVGRNEAELAQDTVRVWGAALHIAPAQTVAEFAPAFASLVAKGIEALATSADALFVSNPDQLGVLAARYRVPTVLAGLRAGAVEGALMSYNGSVAEGYRDVGRYAGRILKGEKPADLPVLLPTKFEFVINLKTAKLLGLTISNQLQLIADEIIE